ncbi:DUF1385 domain-containing protein [Candidatus Woesearchaeota archaeon]|nr:DUF1385 domain-containing protein [Candidatus Woesearchaeota archaeon]
MEAIGGQALIEGVLMRNKNLIGIAVRKPDGKIKTKTEKLNFLNRLKKIIFIRGIIVLVETLYVGTKALIYSANEAGNEKEEKINKKEVFLSLFLSVIFALGFFVFLPLYLTKLIVSSGILFNIIDGFIRIFIFVLYIIIISFMKDIKRVFQYHGAEHMAVHCYENKDKLNIENCRKYSTVHPRCGTNFLFIVLILSILIFSLITSRSFLIKIFSRIVLIPVIASVSYEFLKLGAKFKNNLFLRILTKPGLLLQKVTTRNPEKDQIEVAISALKLVVE